MNIKENKLPNLIAFLKCQETPTVFETTLGYFCGSTILILCNIMQLILLAILLYCLLLSAVCHLAQKDLSQQSRVEEVLDEQEIKGKSKEQKRSINV